MTHVDSNFLAPAGLHLVNVGDRNADTGEATSALLDTGKTVLGQTLSPGSSEAVAAAAVRTQR